MKKVLAAACIAVLFAGTSFAREGTQRSTRTETMSKSSSSDRKIGIGFNNQLSGIVGGFTGVNGLSIRYWDDKLGLEGILGFASGDVTSSVDIGGKFLGLLKKEQNMNIYGFGIVGIESYSKIAGVSNSDTSFLIGGGLGTEFFIPGLPNLGFSAEIGLGFRSLGKDSTEFATFSGWLPDVGIRYYF
jgi:hypothetical protein